MTVVTNAIEAPGERETEASEEDPDRLIIGPLAVITK
jgi:hypothetical protein